MKKRNTRQHNFVERYWSNSGIYAIIIGYIIAAFAIISLFGLIYSTASANGISHLQYNDCSQEIAELRSDNFLYFSSVTFYALGYGDICPYGNLIRLLAQIEVALGVIVNTVFIGFLFWKIIGAHLK